MDTIKYLIEDDKITFYKDKQVQVIDNRKFWVFEALKQSLRDSLNVGELNLDVSAYIKGLIKDRSKTLGVRQRLEELEAANMPTEPFRLCVERLPSSVLEANPEIIKSLGTTEIPLTWDGNLVLYQRSAWLNNTSWANDSTFQPFKEVNGKQQASSFTDTMRRCPDTGMAYEVLVRPEDIVAIKGTNSEYTSFEVKAVTQLSKLGTKPKVQQQTQVPIVEYQTNCVGDENNAVRLPFNAGTAAKLVSYLMGGHSSEAALKQVTPAPVALVSC